MDDDIESKVRLFTGLSLSPEVRDYVVGVIRGLSQEVTDVRWVEPENLHVTLKFLGWCNPVKTPELLELIREAAVSLPLELAVGGVGGFPSQGSARVIWVGAEDGQGKLKDVFRHLDRGAEKYGFPREKRQYRPHITVGRSKKGARLPSGALISVESKLILEVTDIVLFRSVLRPTGAEYSVVEKVGPQGRSWKSER